MKIYCSTGKLKVSDVYKDFLGQDIWVKAYDSWQDDYASVIYLRFISEEPQRSGLWIAYNFIFASSLGDLRNSPGYKKQLDRQYKDPLSSMDIDWRVPVPITLYSTDDLLEIAKHNEQSDRGEWDEG